MTTRWEVERAVMRSNIKPLGRLLVLTLLAKADNETAVIPAQFTPSLSTLAAATGLAKSAVAEYLRYLDDLGWVKRSAPGRQSRYERTHYAVLAGRDDPSRPSYPQDGPLASSPQDGLVRDTDSSDPAETQPAVRTEDSSDAASSPHGGQPVVRDTDSSANATFRLFVVSAGGELSAERTPEPSSPPHGHASTKNSSTKKNQSGDRAKRGTRIPENFTVTDEMRAWAREHVPQLAGAGETEKFVDYWRAAAGHTSVKLDWAAAWRNWMRKAAERLPPRASPRPDGLVEHNGMRLRPETAARMADRARFEAMDAAGVTPIKPLAIEGRP